MTQKKKHVLIACFDVSGDHHAANLVCYLQKYHPEEFVFFAFGGERLKKLPVTLLGDYITESSIGIVEGVRYVPSTLRLFSFILAKIRTTKIDLFLAVDGQGRNLPLGKLIKKYFSKSPVVKTAYYFPPPIFIFGRWNLKKLRYFDALFCVFEKNHQRYQAAGLPSRYVGHPFSDYHRSQTAAEEQRRTKNRSALRRALTLKAGDNLVALFPGSRFQEVKALTPLFLKTVLFIQKQATKQTRFVISLSHRAFAPLLELQLKKHRLAIPILHEQPQEIMLESDFLLCCSGTATLEASFLGVPHAVCYKISWLSYWVARFILYVKYIGMLNILAEREVVREFINNDLTPAALAKYALEFLEDERKAQAKSEELLKETRKFSVEQPYAGVAEGLLAL